MSCCAYFIFSPLFKPSENKNTESENEPKYMETQMPSQEDIKDDSTQRHLMGTQLGDPNPNIDIEN